MNFNCEQLSGFAQLDFFLLEETSNWPIEVTDQNSNTVVLSPEEFDVQGTIDEDSIDVNVTPKLSAEGETHDINIQFRFMTRSESLEQLMDQYANRPGIAIGKLNTEFQKMYGTNEEPLYMSFKTDDGNKPDGNGAIIVTIKGETRKRPVFYTVAE